MSIRKPTVDKTYPKLVYENEMYRLTSEKPHYEILQHKEFTFEDHENYIYERYDEIFEDYDANTDDVLLQRVDCTEYLVHYREPEDYQIEHEVPEPGGYRLTKDKNHNIVLKSMGLPDQDRHVKRHSGRSFVERDIHTFCESFAIYNDLGLEKRRGALVYGPPGNGKSYSILRAVKETIGEYDARVFLLTKNSPRLSQLSDLKKFFDDELTVFIIEEITEFSASRGSDLLRFLDGEWSWPKSYTIATTNYPGKLPNNLVDRPGRFDVLISMNEPEELFRRRFLKAFLDDEKVSDRVIDQTEGFSVAYLKELVLRSKMYDRSLESILDEFDFQKKRIKEAFETLDDGVGFVQKTPGQNGGRR